MLLCAAGGHCIKAVVAKQNKKGILIMAKNEKNKIAGEDMPNTEDILRHFSKENRDVFNKIKIEDIKIPNNLSKKHPKKQIKKLARIMKKCGFSTPILVDDEMVLISGYARILAAKELKMIYIPAVFLSNLTEEEANAIRLADNRIAEDAEWDDEFLLLELNSLLDVGFELEEIGFDTSDYDKLLHYAEDKSETHENEKEDLSSWADKNIPARVKFGDIYRLGDHILVCGDSRDMKFYKAIMLGETACIVLTDPPYNCKIQGFVCKTKHKEFAMAAGEMTDNEFGNFLLTVMKNVESVSSPGCLSYYFIDWRQVRIMLNQGAEVYDSLYNILVWNKKVGGQGCGYRNQHELICVFKKKGHHQNHIQLGAYGRYRTNVLDYEGVRATNPESLELLKYHSTSKPVGLLHDILLDSTSPNDIVLDVFGGSGATLLAAQRCGRRCRMIELDERYCDTIIYRWETETGKKATFIKNIGENSHE